MKAKTLFLTGVVVACGAAAAIAWQGGTEQPPPAAETAASEKAPSPTTGAGLVAAVDKDGNLVRPTREDIAEAGAETAKRLTRSTEGVRIELRDPNDPSKGEIIFTPNFNVATVATIDADGNLRVECQHHACLKGDCQ